MQIESCGVTYHSCQRKLFNGDAGLGALCETHRRGCTQNYTAEANGWESGG